MVRLLLASASPARLSTLRSAGIEPVVRVSGVDEDAVLAREAEIAGEALHPADAVLALARAKAHAVADTVDVAGQDDHGADVPPEVLVLGCDSLLELDGVGLGKPADAAEARARWRAMRGRTGVLHTGHWLVDARPDATGEVGATASTLVRFADLSDAEIDAYVATGEPLEVAGAFTIDGLGGPFVTGLDGDHHTVVGLSLPLLRDLLGRLGVEITALWATEGDAAEAVAEGDVPSAAPFRLTTERLVVRAMGAEHARTLAAYRSEPEVARYQGWTAPFTLAQARAFVAEMAGLDPVSPGRWVQLAIEADGVHVGDVAVQVDDEGRQARIGFTLAGQAQGRGYATEAVRAVVGHLFEAGLHRVAAECDARNTASARVLERIGMRREAERRSATFWKGEWTDELEYAVLADEWSAEQ